VVEIPRLDRPYEQCESGGGGGDDPGGQVALAELDPAKGKREFDAVILALFPEKEDFRQSIDWDTIIIVPVRCAG
jgi:hypothetical protein